MAQEHEQPAASRDNTTPSYAQAMVPYNGARAEIDLIDVGVSLWHRWKLMLIVFLICVGLALALAFVVPKKYSYSTTIQIGTQIVGDRVQPVEPPDSAAKKVENGFLPEIVQQHAKRDGINPKVLTFSVSSPEKTDLVVITGKAPDKLADTFSSIEKTAATQLINSELPLTRVMRAKLEGKLAAAQAKVKELEDPMYKSLLKEQIASLKTFKKQAEQQQLESSRHARSANDAMSSLLLGNQVQKSEKQLSDLQQALNIKLPGQIASAKADVSSITAEINNLQASQIVAGPLRSAEPTSLPRSIIGILGAVIGAILALIAAASVNYVSAVRLRLHENRHAQRL